MCKKWLTTLMVISTLFSPLSLAKENNETEFVQMVEPELWRKVQDGERGFTLATGAETGQLINTHGLLWRDIRNEWVSPLGLFFLGSSAAVLLLFYLWAGQIPLSKAKTGKKILRWTPFDRAIHWFTAIHFLLLGVSGIIMLYGKHFLKPILSDSLWGNLIYAAKMSHNYLGPLFVIGLVIMLVKWMKNNWINKIDIQWCKEGGGILPNGKHPAAEFCNFGEKIWFWLLASVGMLVCITGLILDFPLFGQTRQDMQIASFIHALTSLGLFAAALGHIYIGTVGTEGALEGMTTGYVDASWAKQHHKLWFDKVINKNLTVDVDNDNANSHQ